MRLFGYGISKALRAPTKERYSLSYLRGLARRAGISVEHWHDSKGAPLLICLDPARESLGTGDSVEAFRIINQEIQRQTPAKPQPTFKILFMTDEGRCIDEYIGVYPNAQRPGSSFLKPLEVWLRNTLLHAEQMQLNGRSEKMPKLRRCEGAKTSLHEIRKRLYQQTHAPWAKETSEGLWALIESYLNQLEERIDALQPA